MADENDRWSELHRQLQDLADGKVIDADPCQREDEIQEELDGLEFEAGLLWMKERWKENAQDSRAHLKSIPPLLRKSKK